MENAIQKVSLLIEQGEQFTYGNFSMKGEYGYPAALSPEWVAWSTRVNGAIKGLLGTDSASMKMLVAASDVRLLGNGQDKFLQVKGYYLGALTAAKEVLSEDTFGELLENTRAIASKDLTNKVFVVHGHDEDAKYQLEIILAEMGLEPVVLHRKADSGRTIIEKFEEHADVGFAFVLLTPDEVAYLADQASLPDDKRKKEFRARPNVIFEFGYFVGRLGRHRTCCVYRGNVTLPSDLSGLLYKKFEKKIEEIAYSLQKELKAAGYTLK